METRPSLTDQTDDWAPETCTLPTAERPLRVAEFDRLFASALRGMDRPTTTRLRLWLDPSVEDTARELAGRETACCSFFDFSFERVGADRLAVDVSVPAAQTAVLQGLADQARAATEGPR
jgi:hypothetical protein